MEGIKSFSHEHNGTALTSDLLVRMALNLSTHINHGRNQSSHHGRMAQPLHLTCSSEWINPIQGWKNLNHTEERFLHLHLTWKEMNPLTMIEWLSPYI